MIQDITVVTYLTENHAKWLPHWCKQLSSQTIRGFHLILIFHNWNPDKEDVHKWLSTLDGDIYSNLSIYSHYGERNIGDVIDFALTKVQTTYFAHWDVDDEFHPERLERQARLLEARPEIDFLGTRMLGFTGNVPEEMRDSAYVKENEPNASATTTADIYHCLVEKQQNCLGHSSMIYKAAAMKKIGGFSHLHVRTDPLGRSPDMETWKKALMAGYKFYRMKDLLCYWRLDSSDIRDVTHIKE